MVDSLRYNEWLEKASRDLKSAKVLKQNDCGKEKLILGISIPSETPESLVSKVGIAKRYQLKGIALWRLGLLTNEIWDTLKATVGIREIINEKNNSSQLIF